MKYIPALSLSAAFAFVGCESMNAPLTSSGSFDPLAPAGGVVRSTTSSGPSFKPGQFVQATVDGTAFFAKRPKGDADAEKLLRRDTRMKVISADSSYVKVELDSGEVGFVPTVMVHDPNATIPTIAPLDPSGAVVYPPLPDGGAPLEALPDLTPSNAPPDGVPPTIIPVDPSSPVPPPTTVDPSTAPVTPVPATPVPAAPSAPAAEAPPATAPPLPPGGAEVKQ